MGTSATRAKRKYNEKNYKRFEARLKPELFNSIDTYCKKNKLSKPQFLEIAIKLLEEKQE